MDNQNQSTDLVQLRSQAEKYVVERNGQWVINQFDPTIQGFDFNKTYPNRDVAIDATLNLLRTRNTKAA